VAQRRGGALHDGQHGTPAQRFPPAGDGRRHLDRGQGFGLGIDALGLDVLGGVLPDGLDLVQAARVRRAILGRNRHPVESDIFEVIRHTGDLAHVLETRAAALAAVQVDHFHAAAVRAQVDVVAVRGKSCAGSRAASVYFGGAFFSAASISAAGALTIDVSHRRLRRVPPRSPGRVGRGNARRCSR